MPSVSTHPNSLEAQTKWFPHLLPSSNLWPPCPKTGGLRSCRPRPARCLISRMCYSSAEKFISITQRSLCCLSWVRRVMVHRHGPFAVISKGIRSRGRGAIPHTAAGRVPRGQMGFRCSPPGYLSRRIRGVVAWTAESTRRVCIVGTYGRFWG